MTNMVRVAIKVETTSGRRSAMLEVRIDSANAITSQRWSGQAFSYSAECPFCRTEIEQTGVEYPATRNDPGDFVLNDVKGACEHYVELDGDVLVFHGHELWIEGADDIRGSRTA